MVYLSFSLLSNVWEEGSQCWGLKEDSVMNRKDPGLVRGRRMTVILGNTITFRHPEGTPLGILRTRERK